MNHTPFLNGDNCADSILETVADSDIFDRFAKQSQTKYLVIARNLMRRFRIGEVGLSRKTPSTVHGRSSASEPEIEVCLRSAPWR